MKSYRFEPYVVKVFQKPNGEYFAHIWLKGTIVHRLTRATFNDVMRVCRMWLRAQGCTAPNLGES